MIRALLIKKTKDIQSLDRDAALAWQPDQGLLWLHFDIKEDETKKWLLADKQLPEVVTAALLASETRPRANTIGDGVLLSLRGVNLNPGANPVDMVSISLWIEANRIISTRRRHLLSVDDVVDSLDDHPLTGAGDMVVRLADRLVRRTSDVIDSLDDHISNLETHAAQQSDELNRTDLANLRRDAIALRRYLAPQREALSQLHRGNFSWLTDADNLNLREVGDRLILYLEDLDAFRERASVLQAELVSRLSEQLNQRMYVLSIVAAMFLPLGFLTGLLGINLGGIPGAQSPFGFMTFSLLMLVIAGLQLWIFTKKRWF
jgi:zinc transporter